MRRTKPFPKNVFGKVDKDAVRVLYVSDPDYSWTTFCTRHGFNPDLRREFPISSWHVEWLSRNQELQAEVLVEQSFGLKGEVLRRRASAIRDQLAMTDQLRQLLGVTISASRAQGRILSSRELQHLANASKTIQQIEFNALLMTPQTRTDPIEIDSPHIQGLENEEIDAMKSEPIHILGHEGTDRKQLAIEIAKHFDQFNSESTSVTHGECDESHFEDVGLDQ